jgi:hypothetical protein
MGIMGRLLANDQGITYVPTEGEHAPRAPPTVAATPLARSTAGGPSSSQAGPSRNVAFGDSKSSVSKSLAMMASKTTPGAKVGSASSHPLVPTHKHNIPSSSPSDRYDSKPNIDRKPWASGSKSRKSMLDMLNGESDDEVIYVAPDDIPVEFRKITNKDAPYAVEDEDEESDPPAKAPAQSSSTSGTQQTTRNPRKYFGFQWCIPLADIQSSTSDRSRPRPSRNPLMQESW